MIFCHQSASNRWDLELNFTHSLLLTRYTTLLFYDDHHHYIHIVKPAEEKKFLFMLLHIYDGYCIKIEFYVYVMLFYLKYTPLLCLKMCYVRMYAWISALDTNSLTYLETSIKSKTFNLKYYAGWVLTI